MCAGCGAPPVVRTVLRALKEEDHAVIGSLQRAVWKFRLSCIPIPHGRIPSFIAPLSVQVLLYQVWRQTML